MFIVYKTTGIYNIAASFLDYNNIIHLSLTLVDYVHYSNSSVYKHAVPWHDNFPFSIHCKVSNTCFNLANGYYIMIISAHAVSIGFSCSYNNV